MNTDLELLDTQEIIKTIRHETVAILDIAPSAIWNGFVNGIYVEHLIIDEFDSFWTVGPIILDNGATCKEQYTTTNINEAVRTLEAARQAVAAVWEW